jgi:L-asparaginase / beta-aspartyl-peptidase
MNSTKASVISLIVHGGAWEIPDEAVAANREGVMNAVRAGWEVLTDGGGAADAVERAVLMMEDDETFNAGRGSVLNAVGETEMDASMMEGNSYRAGAVAAVQRIAHPVSLARLIMDKSENVLLVGLGASRFAQEHGMSLCGKDDLITHEQLVFWRQAQAASHKGKGRTSLRKKRKGHDTVGAVALDRKGHIVAAASTGGTPNKYPGRVGDSPLVGSGVYADDTVGGAVATGVGEDIIRVVLVKSVMEIMERNGGDPEAAARAGIELLQRKVQGHGGIIVMSKKGEVSVASNTPRMARAYMTSGMRTPAAFV